MKRLDLVCNFRMSPITEAADGDLAGMQNLDGRRHRRPRHLTNRRFGHMKRIRDQRDEVDTHRPATRRHKVGKVGKDKKCCFVYM